MKTFKLLMIVTLIGVALVSCKKSIDFPEGYGIPYEAANMSAKVDGRLLTCKESNAEYDAANKTIQINGINAELTEGIDLIIDGYKGVGEYKLEDNQVACLYIHGPVNQGILQVSTSANIKITAATDKVVKGTFEFIAENPIGDPDKKVITEGKFSVNITKI